MHRINKPTETAYSFNIQKVCRWPMSAYMHEITMQCLLPLGHLEGQEQAKHLPVTCSRPHGGKLCLRQAVAWWCGWLQADADPCACCLHTHLQGCTCLPSILQQERVTDGRSQEEHAQQCICAAKMLSLQLWKRCTLWWSWTTTSSPVSG